jgi:catechol 2,3-dioxygenase-like lactoylglutathione lyase family enzyme
VKINLTSVHVDDQEKALRFYTEVLGFVKKADFSQGPFRWLTVASARDRSPPTRPPRQQRRARV